MVGLAGRIAAILVAALAATLLSGCVGLQQAEDPYGVRERIVATLHSDTITLLVERDPFALVVKGPDGDEMLRSVGPVTYRRVTDKSVSRFLLWWYWTAGASTLPTRLERVVDVHRDGETLLVDLGRERDGRPLASLEAEFLEADALHVSLRVRKDQRANRTRMFLARDRADRYYGMGQRFDEVEHSGKEVRVWTEEGGLGLPFVTRRRERSPVNPFPKGQDTTYYPVPFYLNPAKNYGFLLNDHHFSRFDFGRRDDDRIRIENWNDRLDFTVFYGSEPLDVIENYTAQTGRISVPPKWAFAPMNAVVKGQEEVLDVARLIRREGIPTSAIWSESWWWRTEWRVNRELYPEYEEMNATLEEMGFKSLGYFQPYLTVGKPSYEEAADRGYLTETSGGKPYDFSMGFWHKAQLDITDPDAREWWSNEFFEKAVEMGVDGWMHDFGEHTPPDSVSDDGSTGWELHNEYPLKWHKFGRDFWESQRPDGDYVMYIRSGYTGAQKYIPIMWTGDQNASFGRLDGLPSNLPAILSVGISGHPIATTDIAGYNCFVTPSSDRELFMRWTELGALLPVMRIHRGHDEVCDHWRFDNDRTTLDHFARYARLHTALFPYFYTLVHEAAETGHPVVRHPLLHFPEDPETWNLDYQYLIGDRLMVAPVLERGADTWKLYLPKGSWVHWWSGERYEGPGTHTVAAPLGEVPFFVKTGTILPLFNAEIDTLVEVDRPDIAGWETANASMEIRFYGTGSDELTLWDGTRIACTRSEGGTGTCTVSDAPVEREYTYDFR